MGLNDFFSSFVLQFYRSVARWINLHIDLTDGSSFFLTLVDLGWDLSRRRLGSRSF